MICTNWMLNDGKEDRSHCVCFKHVWYYIRRKIQRNRDTESIGNAEVELTIPCNCIQSDQCSVCSFACLLVRSLVHLMFCLLVCLFVVCLLICLFFRFVAAASASAATPTVAVAVAVALLLCLSAHFVSCVCIFCAMLRCKISPTTSLLKMLC